MKRIWIGITVLAVLLASGCAVTYFMERCHRPISEHLAQAAEAALAEDWPRAEELANQAQEKWQRCRDFTAAFADHSVLDEAESLLGEIAVYAAARESLSFAATCSHLSRLAEAIAQSHSPLWQNLL